MCRLPLVAGLLPSGGSSSRRSSPPRRRATVGSAVHAVLLLLVLSAASPLHAAKLVSVSVLDKDYLVVHFLDGEVTISATDQQTVTRYTPALSTAAAVQTANWTLKSSQDGNYGSAGKHPLNCYRKTKLSGHGQMEWVGSDYRYEYTYQHWIFLRLPNSLQQGMTYTLEIARPRTAIAPRSRSPSTSTTADPRPCTSTSSATPRTRPQGRRPLLLDGGRRRPRLLELRGQRGLPLRRGPARRTRVGHGELLESRAAATWAATT